MVHGYGSRVGVNPAVMAKPGRMGVDVAWWQINARRV